MLDVVMLDVLAREMWKKFFFQKLLFFCFFVIPVKKNRLMQSFLSQLDFRLKFTRLRTIILSLSLRHRYRNYNYTKIKCHNHNNGRETTVNRSLDGSIYPG
jgi:hypothetical protein